MRYIKLSNGQQMPSVGLGLWQGEDSPEYEASINDAFEVGYRHFDTATVYGNEHVLGRVMKRWLDSGKVKREELFITTKLPPTGMTPEKVGQFLTHSLQQLQLNYVDLYLIHCPMGFQVDENGIPIIEESGNVKLDMDTNLEEIWKAMEAQVELGRTKSIGISNFNIPQVERIVKVAKILPVNQQVEMNAYFQQRDLRQICSKYNISVTAYGPLANPGRQEYYQRVHNKEHVDTSGMLNDPLVTKIGEKYGKTNAQILIRFLVELGVAAIPKSANKDRLKNNFNVFDFELSPEDMKVLESLDKGEAGRTNHNSFKLAAPGVQNHPEYPFPE